MDTLGLIPGHSGSDSGGALGLIPGGALRSDYGGALGLIPGVLWVCFHAHLCAPF